MAELNMNNSSSEGGFSVADMGKMFKDDAKITSAVAGKPVQEQSSRENKQVTATFSLPDKEKKKKEPLRNGMNSKINFHSFPTKGKKTL